MEIKAETLTSSLTTVGEKSDAAWFKKLGSPIANLLTLPSISISGLTNKLNQLLGKIGNLTKQLGNWSKLLQGASKKVDDYKGMIVSFAKKPGGWITGGLATLAALGGAFVLNQIGISPQNVLQAGLNFGETLWNFNFQYTDKELLAQINGLIDGLYGPAGDFVGRSMAQLIVGGFTSPPKVQVNIRGLALNWLINPEIRDEMLQSISQFAYQGITVAKQILVRFALLKGRHGFKAWWKIAPPAFKKAIGVVWKDADKVIENWGEEGNKPWSIAGYIEEKVEKIEDQKLQNFTEGFLDSFWDGFRESVEYVYV
ncbi:MAG: hypothetical protein AAFO04_24040 [Cyanobacteria bacterium J06592_8]